MQLNKNTDLKIFEIWVGKDEQNKLKNNKEINKLYDICNECGYKPVVFVCGNDDLINSTGEMIRRRKDKNVAS